eukprot:TRINITY_DN49564_c0_g1_i1.p1 TRINITY_DN49564_c0_g1~~TRINITY_DN49564_c0_g1_i1.p1  ORF type:complete len:483 (+),score=76.74 TRINITY_DN49564_c0_g1_i1:122-1450(+)
MTNTSDVTSYRFTITFANCNNVVYPEGNPFELILGPGEEDTKLLCQRDEDAGWRWNYRWKSRGVFVEQPEHPDAFTDEEFPPDMSSIGESQGPFSCADSVERWVRLPALGSPGTCVLFEDICPNDIRQGNLGNCWFMAAVASMADYPEALQSLFSSPEVSEIGRYDVRIFDIEAMEWSTVTIDDHIPCNICGGVPQPIFAKPDGEEIWAALLEKAFAKYCGSYGMLSGGQPAWALQALTGEVSIKRFNKLDDGTWRRSKTNRDKQIERGARNPRMLWWTWKNADVFSHEDLCAKLSEHCGAHHLMSCMISGDSHTQAEDDKGSAANGLVTKHFYSFLALESIELADGSSACLVKLRNPWGSSKEWTGDWSDGSSKWEENPEAAQALGHEAKADGTFWMSWEDWFSNFTVIQVCPKDMAAGELFEVDDDGADDDDGEETEPIG